MVKDNSIEDKWKDNEASALLQKQNEMLIARLEQLEKQLNEAKENSNKPQVVSIAAEQERVHFVWQAEVADDNVVSFGENGRYGRVVGKLGSFYVPKDELSAVLDERTRWFIDHRWLLVLGGLTDEEREAFGVNYSEGEVLDKQAFQKLADLGDEILEIYPKLCKSHKYMIAQRFFEAYEKGNPHITRELVVKLNAMSKADGNERGYFLPIIEAMNRKDAE